jgi:hypothetical protein
MVPKEKSHSCVDFVLRSQLASLRTNSTFLCDLGFNWRLKLWEALEAVIEPYLAVPGTNFHLLNAYEIRNERQPVDDAAKASAARAEPAAQQKRRDNRNSRKKNLGRLHGKGVYSLEHDPLQLHQQLQSQLALAEAAKARAEAEAQLVRGSIALGGMQVELVQSQASGSSASAVQQQAQQDDDEEGDEDDVVVVEKPPAKKPKKTRTAQAVVMCTECHLLKEKRGHICIAE